MAHGGDIIEELTSDHREAEEVFRQITVLPSGHRDRKRLRLRDRDRRRKQSVSDRPNACPAGAAERRRVHPLHRLVYSYDVRLQQRNAVTVTCVRVRRAGRQHRRVIRVRVGAGSKRRVHDVGF